MEVIFEAFREFTKEKYITLEELLDVLCQVAERSELLKDSVMVLDGYTGFTRSSTGCRNPVKNLPGSLCDGFCDNGAGTGSFCGVPMRPISLI